MVLWIVLLIVLIALGLALTLWIVWRAAKAQGRRTSGVRASNAGSDSKVSRRVARTPKISIAGSLKSLFAGSSESEINQKTWGNLKDILVSADTGAQLADQLVKKVKSEAGSSTSPEEAVQLLAGELEGVFDDDNTLKADGYPSIWLIVGVNGSGKTTSIAKLANQEKKSGKKVVLAAADTFRAAAVDQLQRWSERLEAGFIKGGENADPSAVAFDAIEHAKSQGADLVLIDTAGRLHTKVNLMEELAKIKRSAEKAGGRVDETLLVIDSTTGQNGLTQANQFAAAVGVTGIILSKLDGTAKGGIVLAIAHQTGIPIKRVGTGEALEDLETFSPKKFVGSLVFDG